MFYRIYYRRTHHRGRAYENVAVVASQTLAGDGSASMLLQYGPGTFGSTFCPAFPVAPGASCQLSQGTGFDAIPFGNTSDTPQVSFATNGGVGIFELNTGSGSYEQSVEFSSGGAIPGTPRAAVRTNLTGPLLVLSQTGSSRLSLVDPDGTVTDVGAFSGEDGRKLRCVGNLCAISVFDDGNGAGALRLVIWDGLNAPTAVDTLIPVGNGPVNLDLLTLTNGNILIVSTGFNDDSISLTEVTTSGELVFNNNSPAPAGCSQPAHAVLFSTSGVPEEAQVIGTCFGSSQYFILDIVSDAQQGFSIAPL